MKSSSSESKPFKVVLMPEFPAKIGLMVHTSNFSCAYFKLLGSAHKKIGV